MDSILVANNIDKPVPFRYYYGKYVCGGEDNQEIRKKVFENGQIGYCLIFQVFPLCKVLHEYKP